MWFGKELLCEHTHTRPYLEDGNIWTGINRIGDGFGYIEVGQEMLAEIFLGSYAFHIANLHIFFHISDIEGSQNKATGIKKGDEACYGSISLMLFAC